MTRTRAWPWIRRCRARQEESGRQVGREEATRTGEDDPVTLTIDQAPAGQLGDHRGSAIVRELQPVLVVMLA